MVVLSPSSSASTDPRRMSLFAIAAGSLKSHVQTARGSFKISPETNDLQSHRLDMRCPSLPLKPKSQ